MIRVPPSLPLSSSGLWSGFQVGNAIHNAAQSVSGRRWFKEAQARLGKPTIACACAKRACICVPICDTSVNLLTVGAPGVGKSCFLMRAIDDKFTESWFSERNKKSLGQIIEA